MPKLTVLPHEEICPERVDIEAPVGVSICRVLLDHHINIEHACECACACTTCHVVVTEGYATLPAASDTEEDLLDQAWGVSPTSRLSCQTQIGTADLTIKIPRYSRNHAKEN